MAQQTWLITGANSGFGRTLTEQLLQRGDRVAGTTRKLDQLDDLQAKYGGRLWLAHLDLTDHALIRQTVDTAFSHFGKIDVVASSAGYGLFGAAEELTDEQIRHQIDTNLIGSIQLIRAALPHLRAQNGGRILQFSSTAGQYSFPGFGLYHATKWGIEGFCESLAKEVTPLNIGVTIVEGGATRTNFEAGVVTAPAIDAYRNTPVHDVRRALETNTFPIPGDVGKMCRIIIDSIAMQPAPLRLPMGSDTYTLVHEVLQQRLAVLESQKDMALSTDRN